MTQITVWRLKKLFINYVNLAQTLTVGIFL